MTREQQLEIALWAVLDLIRGGTVHTDRGTPADQMLAVQQGWAVLGPEVKARLDGMKRKTHTGPVTFGTEWE